MKQRRRIRYSASHRAEIWDRVLETRVPRVRSKESFTIYARKKDDFGPVNACRSIV